MLCLSWSYDIRKLRSHVECFLGSKSVLSSEINVSCSTTQKWLQWDLNQVPHDLKSSTLPLRCCAKQPWYVSLALLVLALGECSDMQAHVRTEQFHQYKKCEIPSVWKVDKFISIKRCKFDPYIYSGKSHQYQKLQIQSVWKVDNSSSIISGRFSLHIVF